MSNMVYPQNPTYPGALFERTSASVVVPATGQVGPQTIPTDPMRSSYPGHTEIRTSNTLFQQASVVFYPPVITIPPQKKEIDELARKQEEFILRCQYPKRILPGEMICDPKKGHYIERRRERSTSPLEPRRKTGRHQLYRSFSKSPSRLWRQQRRDVERSQSRSPRRHGEFTPPASRSPVSNQQEQASPRRTAK